MATLPRIDPAYLSIPPITVRDPLQAYGQAATIQNLQKTGQNLDIQNQQQQLALDTQRKLNASFQEWYGIGQPNSGMIGQPNGGMTQPGTSAAPQTGATGGTSGAAPGPTLAGAAGIAPPAAATGGAGTLAGAANAGSPLSAASGAPMVASGPPPNFRNPDLNDFARILAKNGIGSQIPGVSANVVKMQQGAAQLALDKVKFNDSQVADAMKLLQTVQTFGEDGKPDDVQSAANWQNYGYAAAVKATTGLGAPPSAIDQNFSRNNLQQYLQMGAQYRDFARNQQAAAALALHTAQGTPKTAGDWQARASSMMATLGLGTPNDSDSQQTLTTVKNTLRAEGMPQQLLSEIPDSYHEGLAQEYNTGAMSAAQRNSAANSGSPGPKPSLVKTTAGTYLVYDNGPNKPPTTQTVQTPDGSAITTQPIGGITPQARMQDQANRTELNAGVQEEQKIYKNILNSEQAIAANKKGNINLDENGAAIEEQAIALDQQRLAQIWARRVQLGYSKPEDCGFPTTTDQAAQMTKDATTTRTNAGTILATPDGSTFTNPNPGKDAKGNDIPAQQTMSPAVRQQWQQAYRGANQTLVNAKVGGKLLQAQQASSQAPAQRPAPQPGGATGATPAAAQYTPGQQVKLKNGSVVTIKKINPDGTFDY